MSGYFYSGYCYSDISQIVETIKSQPISGGLIITDVYPNDAYGVLAINILYNVGVYDNQTNDYQNTDNIQSSYIQIPSCPVANQPFSYATNSGLLPDDAISASWLVVTVLTAAFAIKKIRDTL